MTTPATTISIRGACKTFGSTQAVRNLDLDIPRGSLCGFLGPNGAGKSTTIRMIMSIMYPDTGTIDVLGSDALHNKDRIGYLPEERGLYRKMKVAAYLEYIAMLKGLTKAEARVRITEWLARIELPNVENKKCEELSKGMQQKVQFLAAVIHDPDLIILDEPFSGLDPVNSVVLQTQIRRLHDMGKTILFSTHVLHHAEQICDRFVLIHKGIKMLDSSIEEIRAKFDPRTLLVDPLDGGAGGPPELRGVQGVRDVRPVRDSSKFEVEVDDGADRQDVMRRIVAHAPLRGVELRRLTMDEVFVRVVMSDRGAEEAALAREELSHV